MTEPSGDDPRWEAQIQRNANIDTLFRRWGSWKDDVDRRIMDLQTQVARSIDHWERMEAVLTMMKEQGTRTTNVLEELAASVRDGRESAERNHAALLTAVADNTRLATWAVERANNAAGSADAARIASGESAGRVSVLTKATIAGWLAAGTAAIALATHLITDYGWPWVKALLSKLP